MNKPILKVLRLHPDAILPKYQTAGAACFDLHAVDIRGFTLEEHKVLQRGDALVDGPRRDLFLQAGGSVIVRTGLSFEVPAGFTMLIFSRSGHGFTDNVRLSNCVGVIDSDYRGELKVKLAMDGRHLEPRFEIKSGDRIAQAMLIPSQQWHLQEVSALTSTERGGQGFGSTGS